MTRVLVILSGCGVFDGSEIHEAVSTLLHLDRHNADVTIAAPNVSQMHVVNHMTGEPTSQTRNVREEAARIARGPVEDLAAINGAEFDAVLLPGGFGAAKNLCNFATAGPDCEVHDAVRRVLTEAKDAGRPLGLICIAPVIGAKLFPGCTVTIGEDRDTAAAIEAMGSKHEPHKTEEICIDDANNIISTPAYMSAERIGQAYEGIGKLVDTVLERCGARTPAGAAR